MNPELGQDPAAVGGAAVLAAGIFSSAAAAARRRYRLAKWGHDRAVQTLGQAGDTGHEPRLLPFKTIGTSGETADLGYGLVSTLTSKLQPLQNLVVIAKESRGSTRTPSCRPRNGLALGAGIS